MKKLLFTISALTSALALQAAEVNVSALTFSTPGPDKYADGSTVLDGEVYALVWSADGNFDGLTADGKLVDANDKLVVALPLAQGGKCPTVVFNIADGYVTGGQFDVLLLDTRKYADGKATVGGVDGTGKPVIVNTTTKVTAAKIATGSAPASAGTATGVAAADAKGSVLPVPEDQLKPVITDLSIVGDNVVLTVENTVGYLNYAVQGGETVSADGDVGQPQTGDGAKAIKLVYPKTANAGFFKVIRK